ncbi:MAG: 3-isopropylmalate/(R)-2-methylmalate dehydratase small subunit [Gammaproteobacteria bacterium]|jgi:3-isopropylmalate/(R)-2-methylmalate dehydratase small subunit
MEAFTTFRAAGIPIDVVNCDTDQIVPARFLRHTFGDPGYDRYLFHDLRFDSNGNEKEFIYNTPPYRDGKLIVADLNWGCGSSREGAVTVMVANGIRCVIAPSFGDIHYNNCMKHGVLPVRLPREACDKLRQQLHQRPGSEISVDLQAQTVIGPSNTVYSFEIAPFDKNRMLKGLDDIAMTRQYDSDFSTYESKHEKEYDWL